MKIVQINAVVQFSSTGRTTSELHESLKRYGHESYVFAPNAIDTPESIRIGSLFDQKYHSLLSHIFGRQGFYSKASTRRVIKQLNDIQPDIVHLRNLHSNYINLPILLEYLANKDIPTVITLHDCWPFTGHCCYFVDSNCNNWMNGCGKCPERHNWNSSWFFDQSARNLQDKSRLWNNIPKLAVIGVSDWVTNFANKSILKQAYTIRRIYNWIDLDLFKPNTKTIHNARPIVLGVAQYWNRQKGLYDFIEVAKQMPDIQFNLIGQVPANIDRPSNLNLIGVTSSVKELVNHYNNADVFFNPSSRETFGKVTAEALSCGTPVVAYNIAATSELVPKQCGELVEPNNLAESINAIRKVINIGTYSANCRQYAESTFCKSKIIDQYITLYKELISL